MNGAESLARTLTGAGVEVCFANPGTSEMHFVAALDRVEGLRCVLGLAEGVVTGAADGYARMAERPASTLLHLGPGLANGLANVHNAKRANTPMVNVVGDHATYHKEYDAPLASDVEGTARPFSHWVRTSTDSRSVAADGARPLPRRWRLPAGSRLSYCRQTPPGTRPTARRRRGPSRNGPPRRPRRSPRRRGSCAPVSPRSCSWAAPPCASRA
jgi:hypothetical protein